MPPTTTSTSSPSLAPTMVERPPESSADAAGLIRWLHAHADELSSLLVHGGAVALRGYAIVDATAFGEVLDALAVERLPYTSGNTPRTPRVPGIYSATEYAASASISLHNELSYSRPWPTTLYFCCVRPADEGGETTLADGRRVLAELDPAVVEAFQTRGVRYVRNLHGGRGLGRSWQATFETEDRSEVARICAASGTEFEWTDAGGLHLEHVGPGVVHHPRTGEAVWFNQAEQFHPTSLPEEVAGFLLDEYRGREEQLPQWASFADGEPIPLAMLAEIREVLECQTVPHRWRRGDFLIVDNLLSLHGRTPYTGAREVLVAMA